MKYSLIKIAVVTLVSLLIASESFGHARLVTPTPRSTRDNNKSLLMPCGPDLPTNNPTVYTPGQAITVTWEETINHAGHFEFYLSEANDQNFIVIPNSFFVDNQNGGMFVRQITLPNVECQNCTLRMIQFMNDDPNMPYQSCADVRLTSGAPPPPPPPPGGGGKTDLSSTSPSDEGKPGFGCGTVHSDQGNGTGGGLALLALPLLLAIYIRKSQKLTIV